MGALKRLSGSLLRLIESRRTSAQRVLATGDREGDVAAERGRGEIKLVPAVVTVHLARGDHSPAGQRQGDGLGLDDLASLAAESRGSQTPFISSPLRSKLAPGRTSPKAQPIIQPRLYGCTIGFHLL